MTRHDQRREHARPCRRQTPRCALAISAIAFVAALALNSAPAQAASYTVWACANGNGQPLGPGDWRGSNIGGSGQLITTCGSNSGENVGSLLADAKTSEPGAPFATGNGWGLTATAATKITALRLWWTYQVNPVSVPPFGRIQIYADATTTFVSDEPDFGTVAGASPAIALDDSTNMQSYDGLSASAVSLRAWCINWCDRSSGRTTARFEAYRLRVSVDDPSPPTGSATGVDDGGRIAGPRPVTVRAADVGGGVRGLSLRVDGQTVDSTGGGGSCEDVDASNGDPLEYNLMRPCPTAREAVLTLQPAHLRDGEPHVVMAVATDAAGQDAVVHAVRVARAAPLGFHASDVGFVNPDLNVAAARAVNGANGGPARMYLAYVLKRHRGNRATTRFLSRRTVRFGQRPIFRGRLTTPAGAPIVGARVWRAVAPSGGTWRLSGGPLITSKTGRITGRMPARGANRDVQLVYFPYSDTSGNGTTPARPLRVRAATTIGLDQFGYRNGETAVFSGQIKTGPVVARKAVYLQAMVSRRWRTFDTTRADPKGHWKLRYRFTATRRLTAYRFRAVIPAETGYPWATGRSRIVRVMVTP